MKLPPLKIGDIIAKVPIIQGGMGIGVSLSNLASAVANKGGIGIISAAQIGFLEKDFEQNTLSANIRALRAEIKKSKRLSPNGIIGINILAAENDYDKLVLAAVEEKVDIIISGAGLPVNLPKLVKHSNTKIAPIVSSGKAAKILCKIWNKKYNYIPDFIIVEGPEAGGHLGFSLEQLNQLNDNSLDTILKDVLKITSSIKQKYNKDIPVIAAGGIFSGKDIAKYISLGASGVQMATRFVATEECDAHINFKKAYIDSKLEDMLIVSSPVGMPGRALNNNFIKHLNSKPSITKCYNCLKNCNPSTTPYCISKALINAVKGDIDNGLVFAGLNAYKLKKLSTVSQVIDELITEAEQNL